MKKKRIRWIHSGTETGRHKNKDAISIVTEAFSKDGSTERAKQMNSDKYNKEEVKYRITANTIDVFCAADGKLLRTRDRVLSSHIFAIGRSPNNHDTEVHFMDQKTKGPGRAAVYYDVPVALHNAFIKAVSSGDFFHDRIKDQFDWNYLPGENEGKSTTRVKVKK